jgi:hypothetical protein
MSSWVASRRSSASASASATAANPGSRAAKATSKDKKRVALGNLTNVVGGKAGAADAVWLLVVRYCSRGRLLAWVSRRLGGDGHVETSSRCDTYRVYRAVLLDDDPLRHFGGFHLLDQFDAEFVRFLRIY